MSTIRSKPGTQILVAMALLATVIVGTVVLRARAAGVRRSSNAQLVAATPKRSTEYGYVSSDRCMACHPAEYESWHDSYHRTMTQVATPDTVLGDFDGVSLPYFDGRTFNLFRKDGGFFIGEKQGSSRVVQTTGSHHYQMYWIENNGVLTNFPFVYLLDEKQWVLRNDVFLHSEFDKPEGARVWNTSCIKCHSTHGQPKLATNVRGTSASHGVPQANTFVAELGISCEACHGPGEEHIELYSNPVSRYAKHVAGRSDPKILNPAKQPHQTASQICGQCHGITSPRDNEEYNTCGFTFRPGDQLTDSRVLARHPAAERVPELANLPAEFYDGYFWRDGMVRVSGREFNGLVETPCYQQGELSCLTCHSMHDSDPSDQLRGDQSGNDICLTCHESIGRDLTAHTHHAATSSGSQCYNCHMPHTTYGLVKAIRSHTISSPSAKESVEAGRPNACNACHLDKTLQWTSKTLSDWYRHEEVSLDDLEQSVSAALLWMLKGDAGQRAIATWQFGWKPAQEASGTGWMAPFVSELLADPYPVVRSIAGRSLKSLPGYEDFDYAYADKSTVARKRQEARGMWQPVAPATMSEHSACLLDASGNVDEPTLQRILEQRDNRRMDLLE